MLAVRCAGPMEEREAPRVHHTHHSADLPGHSMDSLIRFLADGVVGPFSPSKTLRGAVRGSRLRSRATLTLAFWSHGSAYVSTEGDRYPRRAFTVSWSASC